MIIFLMAIIGYVVGFGCGMFYCKAEERRRKAAERYRRLFM